METLERWGKLYKSDTSVSLSGTFHSFEKVKTSGLDINNSGWVLFECCMSKTVGVILTPNVGSYWCGWFPQTSGNHYLPSCPASPPHTSPSCGTVPLYCRAIPVWYRTLPTAVRGESAWGVMQTLWRKSGRNKLLPKEQGRNNVKYKLSFSSANLQRNQGSIWKNEWIGINKNVTFLKNWNSNQKVRREMQVQIGLLCLCFS